jgi:hypothetical protein
MKQVKMQLFHYMLRFVLILIRKTHMLDILLRMLQLIFFIIQIGKY